MYVASYTLILPVSKLVTIFSLHNRRNIQIIPIVFLGESVFANKLLPLGSGLRIVIVMCIVSLSNLFLFFFFGRKCGVKLDFMTTKYPHLLFDLI